MHVVSQAGKQAGRRPSFQCLRLSGRPAALYGGVCVFIRAKCRMPLVSVTVTGRSENDKRGVASVTSVMRNNRQRPRPVHLCDMPLEK